MVLEVILSVVLTACSGVLYRLGGMGDPPWWKDTKVRDLGVPACGIGLLLVLDHTQPWWTYFLSFGLAFGSMTTYFKGDGVDVKWYHWFLVGLAFGVSVLPYVITSGHWLGFLIRTLFLSAGITLWSEMVDKDWLEEGGRGVLFTSTIPFLLI